MTLMDRFASLFRPEASVVVPRQPTTTLQRAPFWAFLLGACILITSFTGWGAPAIASPGLCVGPVCADEIARSAKHHWQLRLRLVDQSGHRERITVDCRDGRLSPDVGRVDRAYGSAVARRACRL